MFEERGTRNEEGEGGIPTFQIEVQFLESDEEEVPAMGRRIPGA